MKKLLLALVAFFALSFGAFAAVNLNTATKEELDTVKGIGPVKAQAIIDYRNQHGPFKSVDDLKNVKGFGDKTVAKMRSELSVSGATTVGSGPAKAGKAEAKKEEKAETSKAEKAGQKDGEEKGDKKQDKKSKKDKKKAQKDKKQGQQDKDAK
jgi:competence protein ComEA